MTHSPKLSIIIPLYNDKDYIEQCISSVLDNKSNQIELVISDDHSFDGSLDICKRYIDDRVKIVRPKHPLGTVRNWLYGLNHSKGEYIYFLAGDDYLSAGILDDLVDNFDGDSIYTAPMDCFDDKTGRVIEGQMYPEQYISMFGRNNSFVKRYLKYFNHDEMSLSFFPRRKTLYWDSLIEYSVGSVFWFWVAIIFHNASVKNIPKTVLYKRYNHVCERANWKNPGRESTKIESIVIFFLNLHFVQSFCDIYNSIIVGVRTNSINVLLFSNRKISGLSGGMFGLFPDACNMIFFRPNVLIEFILSPLISVYSLLKRNLHR